MLRPTNLGTLAFLLTVLAPFLVPASLPAQTQPDMAHILERLDRLERRKSAAMSR